MILNVKKIIQFILLLHGITFCQNFITTNQQKFYLDEKEINFLGFNTYYLQSLAGDSTTRYIVDDVLSSADKFGMVVARTWAFYENSSHINNSVIRKGPYEFLEKGLTALDYVLFKAREKGVFLILTLSNNYKDYGGIPEYLKWADDFLPGNYVHNDFFINDSLKHWFKLYIEKLLNRTNTFTGVKYKDDPAIFSWEIMNEAENPGMPAEIIESWYVEISKFIKEIDNNHLVATGETGYDDNPDLYSDIDFFYESSSFLLNGYKGTSYYKNNMIPEIDYTSFHSYPNGWGLSAKAGKTWIKDHNQIAKLFNKPVLLGEFGIKDNKYSVYDDWLKDVQNTSAKSALVWQYLHKDLAGYNDGYGFNEYSSPELFGLFSEFIKEINTDSSEETITDEVVLSQNFPNPFNPVTTIKFSLPSDDFIELALYTILGEKLEILDKGFKEKGEHELILSFDNYLLASGIYFYSLKTSDTFITMKLLLLK